MLKRMLLNKKFHTIIHLWQGNEMASENKSESTEEF